MVPLWTFLLAAAAVALLVSGFGLILYAMIPQPETKEACDCPCHSHEMFPGMVCLDCLGEPCGDERYRPE
jgi:hypothetical protein